MVGMQLARQYWDQATELGSPNATTTFHTLYNKHDMDERPFALGYLTMRKFLRFVQSDLGQGVTGVDCTKPSRNSARQDRVRRTVNEFFELCVKYSKRKERMAGDYANVGQVRSMPDNSYCLFIGFVHALLSPELPDMIARWQREEAKELADTQVETQAAAPIAAPAGATGPIPHPIPPPATGETQAAPSPPTPDIELPAASATPTDAPSAAFATAPTPEPEPEPEATPAPAPEATPAPMQVSCPASPKPLPAQTVASASAPLPNVVGKHARAPSPVRDDDDATAAPAFPPSKRAKTGAKTGGKRVPDVHASTFTTEWAQNSLGKLVLRDFNASKANAKSISFGPTSAYTFNERGDYKIVLKKRREGRSGASGATDAYVYLSGESKRIAGISQLRSVPEVTRHFNQHPALNRILSA